MYMTLNDCRTIAWCIAHPWTCEVNVEPDVMAGEYRKMLRSRLESSSNVVNTNWSIDVGYRIAIRNDGCNALSVYETCMYLVLGEQRIGTIAGLACDGKSVTFRFFNDDTLEIPDIDAVSFKAANSLAGVVFDSKEVS